GPKLEYAVLPYARVWDSKSAEPSWQQSGRIGPKGNWMRCARCEGLMVTVWMGDLLLAGTVKGWRCLLCGEATDPGIEANRKNQPPLTEGRPRLPGSVAAWHGKRKL